MSWVEIRRYLESPSWGGTLAAQEMCKNVGFPQDVARRMSNGVYDLDEERNFEKNFEQEEKLM